MAVAPETSSPPITPEDLFNEVLREALRSDDVANNVAAANVSEDELAEQIRAQRAAIFQSFAPEISEYRDARDRLLRLSSTLPPEDGGDAPEPPDKRARVKGARAVAKRGPLDQIIATPEHAQEDRRREVFSMRSEVAAALANLRHVMLRAVTEACRSALNRLIREPEEETHLKLQSSEGLAQVVDHGREIPTKAVDELGRLLRRMNGGSVGVSGPRGAGKTTLLERFCQKREPFGTRPCKAVLVSAPVAYDSREFLGHLTAVLCIEFGGRRPDAQGAGDADEAPAWNWSAAIGRLLLLALAIFAPLAALAGLAGFVSEVQSAIDPQAVWGAAAVLGGVSLWMLAQPVTRWLRNEGLPPAGLLIVARLLSYLGIALVVGGAALAVAAALGAEASGTAIRAGALLLGALVLIGCVLELLLVGVPGQDTASGAPAPEETDPLVNRASTLLAEIYYQQSYARGYSLGGAVGPVQGSVSGETTLARQTMTYPELVSQLRGLLALAARQHDVLIGIDELDKLETGPTADRFLNELKAIFGVPSTYFLVSVSEDAMSRFERRGLPFRDVFDSTFDEIVRVEPLSLGEAQQLLANRVVGLPLIYSALCHVLSGGLPRDLIRTARRLVEVYENSSGKNDLESLVAALMCEEFRAKADAVRFAAGTEAPPEPLLTNFVAWLVEFGETIPDREQMIAFCSGIETLATGRLPVSTLDAEGKGRRSKVLRMGLELGAYGYFAATVLEVFRNDLTPEEIRRVADGTRDAPTLEALAKARAAFVVNPNSAWVGVSCYREEVPCDPILQLSPQAIA